jgi:outer membrane lipoprotein-sorting protein
MKIPISPLILILVLLIISGCTQPYTVTATGKQNSEKIVQLQGSVSDYSATVEEKLQNGGSVITREIFIKRPYMFRVTDSKGCYSVSDGNTRWLYCNGSDTATYFKDPSVRRFSENLDYQKVFADMLNESPGTMMGNDTIDGTDTWILETTPAPRRYDMRYTFKTVRLWADIKTGMILRADLIPENSTNTGIIRFHNMTVNKGFPDDLFTYAPGPGMKIIDQKAGLYTENLAGKAGYTGETAPCTDCPLPISTPQL